MFCKCSSHLQKFGNLYHLKLVALETGYNFFQFHSKSCWTPRQRSIAALIHLLPQANKLATGVTDHFPFLLTLGGQPQEELMTDLRKHWSLAIPFTKRSWNRKSLTGQNSIRQHLPECQKGAIEGIYRGLQNQDNFPKYSPSVLCLPSASQIYDHWQHPTFLQWLLGITDCCLLYYQSFISWSSELLPSPSHSSKSLE